MGDGEKPVVGAVIWADLTVKDVDGVRDFYSQVAGWRASPVDVGGYEDFNMLPPGSDTPAAGVCQARGVNADLPAQWLIYIVVADLDVSMARCVELGGKVIAGPRSTGPGTRYCVIQDPAGAVCALYQAGEGP
ncbi:MAG: VOC family protein [Anaerolineae bacterium]|nr:VOC family protein [Anaerolineae bacterium]